MYYQIRVRLADVVNTSFRTHKGPFEFKVMPFNSTDVPAKFQATMNEPFQPFLRNLLLLFLLYVYLQHNMEE